MLSVTGTSRSQTIILALFVAGVGEWLVDDIDIRPVDGGENQVPNGSLNENDEGWSKRGNHEGSVWTPDGREGGADRNEAVVCQEHTLVLSQGVADRRGELGRPVARVVRHPDLPTPKQDHVVARIDGAAKDRKHGRKMGVGVDDRSNI